MVEKRIDIEVWLRRVSAGEDEVLPKGVLSGDHDKSTSQIPRLKGPASGDLDGLPLHELTPPTIWPTIATKTNKNRG